MQIILYLYIIKCKCLSSERVSLDWTRWKKRKKDAPFTNLELIASLLNIFGLCSSIDLLVVYVGFLPLFLRSADHSLAIAEARALWEMTSQDNFKNSSY